MSDRSLRIGIACYPSLGGSGILATELGIALALRGHDVHFLAYADLPRLHGSARVQVHKIEVSAYPLFKYPPYDLALASKMRALLVDDKLDILHAHYAIPHALCAYLARQMAPDSHAKVITTLHGTDITVVGSDEAYREVTRFGLQHSDRVLAVSRFLADETCRLFDLDMDIDVVPNFVDTDRFVPGPKRDEGPFTVCHLSNFREVKRPLDVIQAFAIVCESIDARLWLIGDGPQLKACLELAAKLGVAERVHSHGPIQNVEDLLAGADLLLQPSGSEAFGLAALEAIACGVPVVGYRVGGLPEVIRDHEQGYLVPFRDVRALARRAAEILGSNELRHRLARTGRERAVSEFGVERCVERHEQIYFEALGCPTE